MDGFPGGSVVKNPPSNAEDARDESSISGLVRPARKEMPTHSTTLAWKNSMDRGAWWATVHEVTKSRMLLSRHLYLLPVSGLEKRVAIKVG